MQEREAHPESLKNLQEVRLRIENIAILHSKLTTNNKVNNLAEYINSIVSNITFITSFDKKVDTQLDVRIAQVSDKISFPLGLILNEWITNSIKHANLIDDNLKIDIEIYKEENEIIVNYKDNGTITENENWKKSIGTEIVEILCLQLGASLDQKEGKKFNYSLSIPIDKSL
jgi:two-component sensor histidine kinase